MKLSGPDLFWLVEFLRRVVPRGDDEAKELDRLLTRLGQEARRGTHQS